MRALVLSSGLGLLAGCFDVGGDLDLDLGGDSCFLPAPCVSTRHPFRFLDETPANVALGGEAEVAYLALDTLMGFDIASLDPWVVTVERRGRDFVMHAVGAGSTVIEARAADGSMLETRGVSVGRVASVGFAFTPAGEQPLAKLAALPGARERIRVLPRDAGGSILGGAEAVVALGFTGGVARIDLNAAQLRPGVFELFSAPVAAGYDVGVEFGALGGGTIAASVGGAAVGSLPIEVVAAAKDVALRVNGRAETKSVLVVGLVGSDANGVPVAGLVGDFAATPAELVAIVSPEDRGEVLVGTLATPGVVTISATLADRVVSTVIAISERPTW